MEKQEKKKGILQTIKEVNQKEIDEQLRREEEEKIKRESEEAKEREAYEKTLKNDRLELLKMKQGIAHEEIKKEEEPKKQYTFFQKIENFMYLNKLYVILGAVFLFIAGFIIVDLVTREEPDVGLLGITGDTYLSFNDSMTEFRDFCQENMTIDVNKDKKHIFYIYDIPLVNNGYYEDVNQAKYVALLSTNDTMLILANDAMDERVTSFTELEDLSKLFPDNPNIQGTKFYLKNTKLMKDVFLKDYLEQQESYGKKITAEEYLKDDTTYICLRKVNDELSTKKKNEMQKYYDAALEVLKLWIDQYS